MSGEGDPRVIRRAVIRRAGEPTSPLASHWITDEEEARIVARFGEDATEAALALDRARRLRGWLIELEDQILDGVLRAPAHPEWRPEARWFAAIGELHRAWMRYDAANDRAKRLLLLRTIDDVAKHGPGFEPDDARGVVVAVRAIDEGLARLLEGVLADIGATVAAWRQGARGRGVDRKWARAVGLCARLDLRTTEKSLRRSWEAARPPNDT